MKKKIAIIVGVLVVSSLSVDFNWKGRSEDFLVTLAARNITVCSKVGGRVTQVLVREGDRVGEAMRASRPMLVVHYGHLQPDHAARLMRMGMARSIPRESYTCEVAVRDIQALLGDQRYADRAADVGARVRTETGTATACDLLDRLLAAANSQEMATQISA
jgi:hypothetical protein